MTQDSPPTTTAPAGISQRTIYLIIGGIALLIGPTLMLIGYLTPSTALLQKHLIQDSISGYYHHNETTRDLFVGMMTSIGLLTLSYRGWRASTPGIDLSIAIVGCMLCLAIANAPCCDHRLHQIHNGAAVALMLLLAFILITRFTENSGDSDETAHPEWKQFRNLVFKLCGWLLVAALLPAGLEAILGLNLGFSGILVTELTGLSLFGFGWLTKSRMILGYRRSTMAFLYWSESRESFVIRLLNYINIHLEKRS
jgi:hypothetical protein